MMKLNKGGMVLTGVGAYLILTKGIRLLRGVVHDISETSKWKAYYHCKRPDPLAPGYNRVLDGDGHSIDGGSLDKSNGSSGSFNGVLSDAIVKTINELFDKKDKLKDALKSETSDNLDEQNYTKDLSDVEIDIPEEKNSITEESAVNEPNNVIEIFSGGEKIAEETYTEIAEEEDISPTTKKEDDDR